MNSLARFWKTHESIRSHQPLWTNWKTCSPKSPAFGPKPDDQINLTDEESRIMPSDEGIGISISLWVIVLQADHASIGLARTTCNTRQLPFSD